MAQLHELLDVKNNGSFIFKDSLLVDHRQQNLAGVLNEIARQQNKLGFLGKMNQSFNSTRRDNTELDARIRAYELAFRMQATAPEAVDLTHEAAATRQLYGIDAP